MGQKQIRRRDRLNRPPPRTGHWLESPNPVQAPEIAMINVSKKFFSKEFSIFDQLGSNPKAFN